MFGFPKIDRENFDGFKNNFLASVVLQFKFEKSERLIQDQAFLIDSLKSELPRHFENKGQAFSVSFSNKNQTPILQTVPENEKSFELKSHDGNKVLTVLNDTFTYTIAGISYSTFDEVKPTIRILQDYLLKNGINSLNRISIRKINIVNFKIEGESEETYTDALSNIINQNLLANFSYFPQKNRINGSMNNLSYYNDNFGLNLIYGLAAPPVNIDFRNIVIDIDLIRHSPFLTNESFDEFCKINDEIFNIFNWSISDYTRELLTRE